MIFISDLFANAQTIQLLSISKISERLFGFAIANGWLTKDPFAKYKARIKVVEKIFLCEEELSTIMKKEFTIKRLNQVKNIFLFSCLTGLAYSDVKKLSIRNIITGIDSKKWLFISRAKTGSPASVPLLPVALELIAKYEHHSCRINKNLLLPYSVTKK